MDEEPETVDVMLEPQRWRFPASKTLPLIVSARLAGIVLPSSCRNGTCRTCMSLALQGSVHYRIEWPGLSKEEKAEGYILPCVAYPNEDLVIDAPEALLKSGPDGRM
jgi:ferredoxin